MNISEGMRRIAITSGIVVGLFCCFICYVQIRELNVRNKAHEDFVQLNKEYETVTKRYPNFDAAAAQRAGYTKRKIIDYLQNDAFKTLPKGYVPNIPDTPEGFIPDDIIDTNPPSTFEYCLALTFPFV